MLRKYLYKKAIPSLLITTLLLACTKDDTGNNNNNNNSGSSSLPERIIIDTSYGLHTRNKMDIYLPAKRDNKTRLIVFIHGGAWVAGDKSDFNSYITQMRSKWPEAAIANINYRYASNTANIHYNEMMSDISSAVQFLVNNKTVFSISDTAAMVGASAGAHMAMLYTYAYNTDGKIRCVADIFGPSVLNDWDWYNSYNLWLGATAGEFIKTFAGAPWNEDLYKSLSPYTRATAASKPTIIFHGTADVIVPLYQSQWLAARLNTLGVPNQYVEYALDGHGFNSTNTNDCLNKIVAFFKTHCK